KIDKTMIDKAKDKIMMGAERRSMIITDAEKEVTAYHEAGHALVARLLKDTDPIHKVTIIPRGRALGVTMQLPKDERYTHSKKFLENTLCILFGGRVAEKLVFNEITTGAGNDIERASDMARKMVCAWGMSEELGPLTFGKKEEQIFLGREISQHRDFSEDTARKIDGEVQKIILTANETVTRLLTENKDVLKRMAEELLEKETIVLDDIERILAELRPGQYEPISSEPAVKVARKPAAPAAPAEPAAPAAAETAPAEATAESAEPVAASAEEKAEVVESQEESVQAGEQSKE
ncbi:MAG: cell division protein FtsH, partial [Proteobacteria bacterium]|nr:cell division protein FtsH [Pseudomonadota bacterium]